MSDTFDHYGQALDSHEHYIGDNFFGTKEIPLVTLNDGVSVFERCQPRTVQVCDTETFGKHKVYEMTESHCRNAIKYIVKTNPNNLSKYSKLIRSLNKRISALSGSKGYGIIDLDTGEILELK